MPAQKSNLLTSALLSSLVSQYLVWRSPVGLLIMINQHSTWSIVNWSIQPILTLNNKPIYRIDCDQFSQSTVSLSTPSKLLHKCWCFDGFNGCKTRLRYVTLCHSKCYLPLLQDYWCCSCRSITLVDHVDRSRSIWSTGALQTKSRFCQSADCRSCWLIIIDTVNRLVFFRPRVECVSPLKDFFLMGLFYGLTSVHRQKAKLFNQIWLMLKILTFWLNKWLKTIDLW